MPADLHMIAVPPPAVTRKPRAAVGAEHGAEAEVVDRGRDVIVRAALEGDLELARQRGAEPMTQQIPRQRFGVRRDVERARRPRRPAYGHAVMLRTELPHASRVVSPASASRRIAGSASCSLTKWNWMFWRVVMWPKPPRVALADFGERRELVARQHALRHLDAQHLRVVGLTLAVGPAHETERTPLVRRHLAALVPLERRHELVDVGHAGERQPRAAVCARIVADRHMPHRWSHAAPARPSSSCRHVCTDGEQRQRRHLADDDRRRGRRPPARARSDRQIVRACRARPAVAAATRRPRSPPASRATSRGRSSAEASAARRADAHEHDDREAVRRRAAPIDAANASSSWPLTTRKADARPRCVTGMPASAGAATALRDARHDLERHARRVERQRLFATAAEHERIAALQPHDSPSAPRGPNHHRVNRRAATAHAGPRACRRRTAARGGPDDRTRSSTSASYSTRSAPRRRATALRVRSAGSPGPAPTRETCPITATNLPLRDDRPRNPQRSQKHPQRISARSACSAVDRRVCSAPRAAAGAASTIGHAVFASRRAVAGAPRASTRRDRAEARHRAPRARAPSAPAHRRSSKSPASRRRGVPHRSETPSRSPDRPPRSRTTGAFSAAAATLRFTSGVAAATTSHAPSRSAGMNRRREMATAALAMSS